MNMQQLSVLVVEDDLLSRMVIMAALEDVGFDAVEMGNAADAIDFLMADKLPNILFTDIDMPGAMDGLGLAEAVRDRWPNIQIVMTSGNYRIMKSPMPKVYQFVSKPYDAQEIASTLRDMAMAA